jgi:hypothetical protein
MVSTPAETSPPVELAIVVAAQYMFGVDAFIVNVTIPTIALELHTCSAQIEAVIAIYLVVRAMLLVTIWHTAPLPPQPGGKDSTRPFYFALQQLSGLGGLNRSLSPRSCRCP